MTDPTPLLGLDRNNTRVALNKLDLMGGLLGSFAPDMDTIVASTMTFGYRGARFRDGLGGVTFEPDGTIVCTDNAISFVQYDPIGGVTIASSLDPEKYAIAEVTCASGAITHIEDLRDLNLHDVPGLNLDDLLDVEIYDPQDLDRLTYDTASGLWINAPDASGSLEVEDEGTTEVSPATILDFRGAGVTVTDQGSGRARVTIPGSTIVIDPDAPVFLSRFIRAGVVPGSNVFPTHDWGNPNSAGSLGFTVPGNGSYHASKFRVDRTPASSADTSYGGRANQSANAFLWRGTSASTGGFHIVMRFSFNTVQTGHRLFVGLFGGTTDPVLGGDPSSRVDIIGIGKDAGDTNLQLIHNDGAGAATKVDTGVVLAAATMYVVELSCPGNGGDITAGFYTEDATGLAAILGPSVISTDLPTDSVLMGPVSMGNTGAQTTAAVISFPNPMWWAMVP